MNWLKSWKVLSFISQPFLFNANYAIRRISGQTIFLSITISIPSLVVSDNKSFLFIPLFAFRSAAGRIPNCDKSIGPCSPKFKSLSDASLVYLDPNQSWWSDVSITTKYRAVFLKPSGIPSGSLSSGPTTVNLTSNSQSDEFVSMSLTEASLLVTHFSLRTKQE